jgi:type IV pilus biogenesis protein CpaD/CtpE
MKRFPIRTVLMVATILLMNGCASNGVVTESSAAQTGAPVPGEKIPDEPTVVPGAGANPNTSMRW